MHWDDLRVFLAVERRGSHKAAARQLGIDPTTVSRRIAALEASLAVQLLQRTPERLLATAAGRSLAAHAARIEAEVLAAERELQAADARETGPLRVTATDGLVHYLLLPELAELRRQHPGLQLELRTESRTADLSRHEADVAVRLARPREPALLARRLGNMPFGLFASLDYTERRGLPRSVAALASHDWIGSEKELDRVPHVRWLERHVPRPRYTLRTNTTTAQARACAEGHGIALLPSLVAAREPRLCRVLPRLTGPVRELWGVYHADLRAHPRVDAFLGWLQDLLAHAEAPPSRRP